MSRITPETPLLGEGLVVRFFQLLTELLVFAAIVVAAYAAWGDGALRYYLWF